MIIPFPADQMASKTRDEIVKGYEQLGFSPETAEAYASVLGLPAEPTEPTESVSVMTVAAALELAKSVGHEQLEAEMLKSAAAGVSLVELVISKADDTLIVKSPDGVMVGYFLDDAVAKAAGIEIGAPHLTLAFLGKADDMSLADQRKLIKTVGEVSKRHSALSGVVKGTGWFEESGTAYAVPHIPGLAELREDLVKSLQDAGLPVSTEHDFTPHITIATGIEKSAAPDGPEPFELTVDTMHVAIGGFRHSSDLSGEESDVVVKAESAPIAKADGDKRFTLAPVYVPGQYDAHGDWADPDDLQEAMWKFSKGERLIALQHAPEQGSQGEAVELMVIPWEHTVPMIQPDGSSQDVVFPAGTPWMGVVWNEDVWPLVKAGKIRGYSIGGRASMLNVMIPEAED